MNKLKEKTSCSKAVMVACSPLECAHIMSDAQTMLVRKTVPNNKTPFTCYLYCTYGNALDDLSNCSCATVENDAKLGKLSRYAEQEHKLTKNTISSCAHGNGKVLCSFVCNKLEEFTVGTLRCDDVEKAACLTYAEMIERFYKPGELDGNTAKIGHAWHISELKIYGKPKEIGEFNHPNKCPNASQSDYDGEWYCDDGHSKNAVIIKTMQPPYNEECIYFDCPRCGGDSCENEDYAYCSCKGDKPLLNPPHNWCYCEELKEKKCEQ